MIQDSEQTVKKYKYKLFIWFVTENLQKKKKN